MPAGPHAEKGVGGSFMAQASMKPDPGFIFVSILGRDKALRALTKKTNFLSNIYDNFYNNFKSLFSV